MKQLLLIALLLSVIPSICQTDPWKERTDFVIGAGNSFALKKLYHEPVISKSTNYVAIDEASIIRSNVSIGITYTPHIGNVIRKIYHIDGDTTIKFTRAVMHYPRGLSYALFINPISFASATTQSLSSMVDLGIGIGYRAGDFLFMGTLEFYKMRQPRDYFIKEYKDYNNQYIVNGVVQTVIDDSDNSIFTDKLITAIGIKIAYTFNISQTFFARSNDLQSTQSAGKKD